MSSPGEAHRNGSSPLARHWGLDPRVVFLNHGSFGACPIPVLEAQRTLVATLEAQPVRFMVRMLEGLLDETRRDLGAFLGAHPDDLALINNATAGVNTVLASLNPRPGDELLTTDHEYNACRNALDFLAARSGATVVVASIPFPLRSEDEVLEAILSRVTDRTTFALVDHVTSPTGLVLPIARIVQELESRGVAVLVDAAHAAGMVDVALDATGASYTTGNCHKWLCTPKGSAFLHVRRDKQEGFRPLAISHGANSPRVDRARLRIEFDWTGTADPTAVLSIGAGLRFMQSLVPGGWPEIRRRNRALALEARGILCETLGVEPPAPDSMIGSMAAVQLPPGRVPPSPPLFIDPLQDILLDRYSIEVPVNLWPAWPSRLVRVSAQLYNARDQYERLAAALRRELASS